MAGAENRGEGQGGDRGGRGGTSRAPPTPPPAAPTSSRGRSGKEGHCTESDSPVSWYTRTLVALGIKSHGDPGHAFTLRHQSSPCPLMQAFTPSQHSSGALRHGTFDPLLGVVLVSSEGYLSRSEFERINNYLECVLREVNSVLGSFDEEGEDEYECQDTGPPVIQESNSGAGLKTLAAIVRGVASRRPGWLGKFGVFYPRHASDCPEGTAVVRKKLSENAEHVQVIKQSTKEIKAVIQDALTKNLIDPDCARDLIFKIDQLGKYTARVLSRNGSRLFTLAGLKERIKLPEFSSIPGKIIGFGGAIRSVMTVAGAAYRVSQSDGPGFYHDVGKEALELVRDPFHLQLNECNSKPKDSLIFGSEVTTSQNLLRKVMLNLKNEGYFMCFKASDVDNRLNIPEPGAVVNEIPDLEDPNSFQVFVKKVANDMDAMLYLPFSLKKSKVELQLLEPFHGSTVSIGLNNNKMPCISASTLCGLKDICLGGVDSLAVGGQLKINESNSWFSFSAGLSVRARMFNAGLTFKQPGMFDYTLCSNILNTSTVLGGLASYSYVTNEWKVIAGISHSIDPTWQVKGRIANDKVASALISKKFAGKGSLHFATEVDLKEVRRSRAGFFFSYP